MPREAPDRLENIMGLQMPEQRVTVDSNIL